MDFFFFFLGFIEEALGKRINLEELLGSLFVYDGLFLLYLPLLSVPSAVLSCLVHDLGFPPYGEAAFWYENLVVIVYKIKCCGRKYHSHNCKCNFLLFHGNA